MTDWSINTVSCIDWSVNTDVKIINPEEEYMQEPSTKERILTAARKLFVEHGFSGTSMGEIAKLACVNHSLIFHHFGNKEQLWVAVKQNIVDVAGQRTRNLPDCTMAFEEFLATLFLQSMKFYRNNQDIVRMINWQRLEPDTEKKIGVTLSGDMHLWIEAFKSYQERGDISSRHRPEFIVTLVLSIISSAALDPNVFIADEKNKKTYIDFCLKLLGNALKEV